MNELITYIECVPEIFCLCFDWYLFLMRMRTTSWEYNNFFFESQHFCPTVRLFPWVEFHPDFIYRLKFNNCYLFEMCSWSVVNLKRQVEFFFSKRKQNLSEIFIFVFLISLPVYGLKNSSSWFWKAWWGFHGIKWPKSSPIRIIAHKKLLPCPK